MSTEQNRKAIYISAPLISRANLVTEAIRCSPSRMVEMSQDIQILNLASCGLLGSLRDYIEFSDKGNQSEGERYSSMIVLPVGCQQLFLIFFTNEATILNNKTSVLITLSCPCHQRRKHDLG
jgi:hypothetical protein